MLFQALLNMCYFICQAHIKRSKVITFTTYFSTRHSTVTAFLSW